MRWLESFLTKLLFPFRLILFLLQCLFLFLFGLLVIAVVGTWGIHRNLSVPREPRQRDDFERDRAERDYATLYQKITELKESFAPASELLELLDFCQRVDCLYAETHRGEHFFKLEDRVWGIVRTLRKKEQETEFNT